MKRDVNPKGSTTDCVSRATKQPEKEATIIGVVSDSNKVGVSHAELRAPEHYYSTATTRSSLDRIRVLETRHDELWRLTESGRGGAGRGIGIGVGVDMNPRAGFQLDAPSSREEINRRNRTKEERPFQPRSVSVPAQPKYNEKKRKENKIKEEERRPHSPRTMNSIGMRCLSRSMMTLSTGHSLLLLIRQERVVRTVIIISFYDFHRFRCFRGWRLEEAMGGAREGTSSSMPVDEAGSTAWD